MRREIATDNRLLANEEPNPNEAEGPLSIHKRSEEIGRFIFTASRGSSEKDANIKSLNNDPGTLLKELFRDETSSAQLGLADYMRATMIGELSPTLRQNDHHPHDKDYAELLTLPPTPSLASAEQPKILEQNPLTIRTATQPGSLPNVDQLETSAEFLDSRLGASKDTNAVHFNSLQDQKLLKSIEFTQASDSMTLDTEFSGQSTGQKPDDESNGLKEDGQFDSEQRLAQEEQSDEYDNWRKRLANLVQERIAIAIRDGQWSVRLNLRALGLESIEVALNATNEKLHGEIYTSDPEVRELLTSSLNELRVELEQSLGGTSFDSVDLKILDKNGAEAEKAITEMQEVEVTASDLLASVKNKPKADDGLDIFV